MTSLPKIVVFGCGYWGKNHVRTLSEIGALAGVVDADHSLAQNMAAQHNTVAMRAEAVFADASIDAVVLALPAHLNAQIALDAFAAGKHVFAEKPIALSVGDAQAMVDAGKKANRVLMVGHILRYHNAFVAIMKLIENGTLGKIKYIQSHRLAFGKFHEKFDAVWDLAPHDLSLLLCVAGRAPISQQMSANSMTHGQNDFAHLHLDFGDGLKGHIHVSRFSPYVERRFTVIGEKAMAVWDDTQADWNKKVSLHHYVSKDNTSHPQFSKQEPEYIDCMQGMALTDELNHFIDCISTGKISQTDGEQGLNVVKILKAVC
ncbi:MAG: Gfo/Idh/MocA family oxidoreductase [Ahrensia sp.]|nr:Gfo/Idh/MocA family oxidoreductase [Ahrensia sp.]